MKLIKYATYTFEFRMTADMWSEERTALYIGQTGGGILKFKYPNGDDLYIRTDISGVDNMRNAKTDHPAAKYQIELGAMDIDELNSDREDYPLLKFKRLPGGFGNKSFYAMVSGTKAAFHQYFLDMFGEDELEEHNNQLELIY